MRGRGAKTLAALVAAVVAAAAAGCTSAPPLASSGPGPTATQTPAASSAGSLVFISSSNVWLSAPDGSGARQLTTDGTDASSYHDPGQSDDGTIWVIKGATSLVRLDRAGHALGAAVTLASLENGAEGLAVAADGQHLAYATVGSGQEIDPRFGTPTGTFLYGGTDIVTPDGSSVPGAVLPNLLFPSWVGDTHVIVSDGVDIYTDTVGPVEPVKIASEQEGCLTDFDCPAGKEAAASLSAPTISDEGSVLAFNYVPYYGQGGRRVATLSDPQSIHPRTRCLIPSATKYNDPGSLSPFGATLFYDDTAFDPTTFETTVGQGVWAMPIDLEADDCGASHAALIVPGGSQPDWGPAAP